MIGLCSACLVVAVLSDGVAGVVADTQRRDEHSEKASSFASTVLLVLAHAEGAKDRLESVTPGGDGVADAIADMTANRIAIRRFQQARDLLTADLNAPREAVQVAARAFDSALQSLQDTCTRSIALDEAVLKMKNADEIPRIASEVSKIAADIDAAWRMFPLGAAALSFVLLDEDRLTDGKVQHLRVTATERSALIAEIKRQYPRIERTGDKHAIEATAWLLLTFLRREFKSADQK